MIILYESTETDFTHNGLGVLNECISAPVKQELNGTFELELYYPLQSKKSLEIVVDRIIKAPTHKGDQLFRIYKTENTLTQVHVFCKHIFFDLKDCFVTNMVIENQTRIGAISHLLQNTIPVNEKFFVSGETTAELHSTTIKKKNGVDSILSTEATTILDTWGGEYDVDNYEIIARNKIGADNGVLIAYAKNLTGLTCTLNFTDVATRIIPIGKDDLYLPEMYIDSPLINNYSHPYVKTLDCSDIEATGEEAYTLMRERVAKAYEKGIDKPVGNYQVSLAILSKANEYKGFEALEKVLIGDTVTVRHSKLNLDLSARVISIKYDALLEKVTDVELGQFAKTLSSTIKSIQQSFAATDKKITNNYTALLNEIAHATALITGADGGYVVMDPSENPSRILIMDTADKNTAKKVWQWNLNGLGYSSTGINGPYETAMTMDGHINAKFLTGEIITGLKITCNDFNMTGGTIDVETSSSTYSVIRLRYDDDEISISPGQINLKMDDSRLMFLGNGVYLFKNEVQVAALSNTAGYSGPINGMDGATGSFTVDGGKEVQVYNGIITTLP